MRMVILQNKQVMLAQTWNLIKKYRLANTYLGERNHNRNFIIHDGSNQTSNHCFLYRYRHSQSNLLLHWNDRLLLEDKQVIFFKFFNLPCLRFNSTSGFSERAAWLRYWGHHDLYALIVLLQELVMAKEFHVF